MDSHVCLVQVNTSSILYSQVINWVNSSKKMAIKKANYISDVPLSICTLDKIVDTIILALSIYKVYKIDFHLQIYLKKNFFYLFLGPHPWHMEVPRIGVKSEPQLPAYTTATAMWNLSCICDLHHSSRHPRSLIHGVRPGIKPASSWIVTGFITAKHNGNSIEFTF